MYNVYNRTNVNKPFVLTFNPLLYAHVGVCELGFCRSSTLSSNLSSTRIYLSDTENSY